MKWHSNRELRHVHCELVFKMNFENNVRATLLYFDFFDHPLTQDELYTFFPVKMEAGEFSRLLSEALGKAPQGIRASDGFFHIRGNDDVVAVRKRREEEAKRMLHATRIIGKLLGLFPFVRAAFLSGSLSKGVNDGDADIDLFIITAEKRLWICRFILTGFKKIFLLNKKKFLCPNYFVTEDHLEIPERNIFTATELITLRPLFNERKLHDILEANSWVLNFYPNFLLRKRDQHFAFSAVQRLLELPMGDGHTANWDARLMNYFKEIWATRYPEFTPSEREFMFRTTPYSSKVHPKDYQSKILSAYENRLRKEKLERLIEIDD